MERVSRKAKFYLLSFLKHDFRASITVFFVALPLCLGVALASGVPVYAGLLAGMIGGLVIPLISKSELSVSGPAAGLTSICAASILQLGSLELFFLSVALAGLLQVLLGVLKLGSFTHFIPSSVIKGMLAAIGIILVSKQVPLLVGYDQPDFWRNEFFNIITLHHSLLQIESLYRHTSAGAVLLSAASLALIILWKKTIADKLSFLPASFITVVAGVLMAQALKFNWPSLSLKASHFVSIPGNIFENMKLPDFGQVLSHPELWRNAVVICLIASLETLLSITAIDKLDPYNRISPQNRELVAQGTGNLVSGVLGGLPITAVIVRSSANAEAGARTRLSSVAHGIWLLLAVVFLLPFLNTIPYCVLAVILTRTGYNLAKPKMILSVYRQGREQFLPFLVTAASILFTDILTGVAVGLGFSIYFLIQHTYRAGFTLQESAQGHIRHFKIELALNVSFLNKRKFMETLDRIPEYAEVEITGSHSVYIDRDVLEIFQDFKAKAKRKHIQLILHGIPEVETIGLH